MCLTEFHVFAASPDIGRGSDFTRVTRGRRIVPMGRMYPPIDEEPLKSHRSSYDDARVTGQVLIARRSPDEGG